MTSYYETSLDATVKAAQDAARAAQTGGGGGGTGTVSDATTSSKGVVQLAGDLGGTAGSPSVAKVNGVAVTGTPTSGQVITATSGTAATWQTPSGGGSTLPTVTKPAVGQWAADPRIVSALGGKDLWYTDSYFEVGPSGYAIDRISVNVTKANTTNTTLTVTAYPVNSDGTINTGSPISGATGNYNVGTTGQKDLTVTATLPAGTVVFRFSGVAAGTSTGLSSKRRLGVGANVGSSPGWDNEPFPVGSNPANSFWEPTVYIRRA